MNFSVCYRCVASLLSVPILLSLLETIFLQVFVLGLCLYCTHI